MQRGRGGGQKRDTEGCRLWVVGGWFFFELTSTPWSFLGGVETIAIINQHRSASISSFYRSSMDPQERGRFHVTKFVAVGLATQFFEAATWSQRCSPPIYWQIVTLGVLQKMMAPGLQTEHMACVQCSFQEFHRNDVFVSAWVILHSWGCELPFEELQFDFCLDHQRLLHAPKVCSPLIAAESGVMGLAQRWYETEVIGTWIKQPSGRTFWMTHFWQSSEWGNGKQWSISRHFR